MKYDLDVVHELASELGFHAVRCSAERIVVALEPDTSLVLENSAVDDDCSIHFEGSTWHGHGDLCFASPHGEYIELDYLSVLSGLAAGSVLICELWNHANLIDRWLIHAKYADEFRQIRSGEEVRVRRARLKGTDSAWAPNNSLERSRER